MADLDIESLRAKFTEPHELLHTSDGKTLFIRRWNAKQQSRASILIFHGITGYSGPYGPILAEPIASFGYDVYAMDLRGHGLSDGKRGDYPSGEHFVKDLTETVKLVKSKSGKLVLLGHSLGALSAIVATQSSPQDIDGLIILSAARKLRVGAFPKPKTSVVLKTLLGVALLRGTPLIEYRREGMLGLDDPLFNFHYSARFYSVLYGTGALRVSSMFRSGLIDSPNLRFDGKLKVPLLVGLGDHDELFTTDGAKEFCDEIDCDDKEFFIVSGARHAMFPKDGWGPLVTWLGNHVQP
jgi:acylglycerol lipase